MQSKILIALIAAAIVGVSSTAMAKGGGGGGGKGGGHAHFNNHLLRNQFLRNQAFFGNGWGWGGGWGGYSEGGNTTIVNFPSVIPGAAMTVSSPPCHWNEDTYTVPSSNGGTKAIQIVGCR